jgi:ribosomal protein S18 acetylase RimI-like enzyme
MPEIPIRRATPSDIESIWALRLKTTDLFRLRGIDQWQHALPDKETFMRDIEAGHFHVIGEEKVIAMIAIKDGIEETYDVITGGAWAQEGAYLTVHRLAVDDCCLGQGLSTRLMRFAEDEARRQGIRMIRIDTHRNNTHAIRLFTSLGYARRGTIMLKEQEGDRMRDAFDKILDEEMTP